MKFKLIFLTFFGVLFFVNAIAQCDPNVASLNKRYIRDTTYATLVCDTSWTGTAGYTYTWTFAGGTSSGPVATYLATTDGVALSYTLTTTDPAGCIGSTSGTTESIPVFNCNFRSVWDVNYASGAFGGGYGPVQGGYLYGIAMAIDLTDTFFTSSFNPPALDSLYTNGISHWGNGVTTHRSCDFTSYFLSGHAIPMYAPAYLYGGEYNLSADITYGSSTLTCPLQHLPQITERFPGAIATPLISGSTSYCAGDTLRLIASDTTNQFHNMLHTTDTTGSADRFYRPFAYFSGGVGRSTYSFEWLDQYLNPISSDTMLTINNLSDTNAGVYIFHIHENMNEGNDSFYYVHVNVSPAPIVGLISGTPVVCLAAATSLAATVPGGSWTSSASSIATVAAGTITGLHTGTAIISYTTSNACGTAVDTMEVTISPLPFAGVVSGPGAVCLGSTISLTADSVGGTWHLTNSNAIISPSSGITAGVSAGWDTATYTINSICGTDTAYHIFSVVALPSAGAITAPDTICALATDTLTAGDAGGVWSVANGTLTITTDGIVTGVAGGTNIVTYLISNACGADTASRTIVISEPPSPQTISGTDSVCAGETVSVSISGTGGGTWSCYNPAVATISATGIITGVGAGNTHVNYLVVNSCGMSLSDFIINVKSEVECEAGVATNVLQTSAHIYPNPNTGVFSIELPDNGSTFVTITDIAGRVVEQITSINKEKTMLVTLSNKARGTYLVTIETGDKIYRDKIIVW